jgi:hypothetical protein
LTKQGGEIVVGFQIDEKMIASDRAIITINKTETDLIRDDIVKFKPGMIHYIEDAERLLLSITPEKEYVKGDPVVKAFTEILTNKAITDYPKIILQETMPDSSLYGDKENVFWYEILSTEEDVSNDPVLITESGYRILTLDNKYIVPDALDDSGLVDNTLVTEDGIAIVTEDDSLLITE